MWISDEFIRTHENDQSREYRLQKFAAFFFQSWRIETSQQHQIRTQIFEYKFGDASTKRRENQMKISRNRICGFYKNTMTYFNVFVDSGMGKVNSRYRPGAYESRSLVWSGSNSTCTSHAQLARWKSPKILMKDGSSSAVLKEMYLKQKRSIFKSHSFFNERTSDGRRETHLMSSNWSFSSITFPRCGFGRWRNRSVCISSCTRPISWFKFIRRSRQALTPNSRALWVMKKHSVMKVNSPRASRRFSFSAIGIKHVSECKFFKWTFFDAKSASASCKNKFISNHVSQRHEWNLMKILYSVQKQKDKLIGGFNKYD